jgi:hypothetical protein
LGRLDALIDPVWMLLLAIKDVLDCAVNVGHYTLCLILCLGEEASLVRRLVLVSGAELCDGAGDVHSR